MSSMRIHLVQYGLALIFSANVCGMKLNIEDDTKSKFPMKRAVDGTRGRSVYDLQNKYFEVPADDAFDIYDTYDNEPDFSDYRSNIPGEPGLDYPSFTRIPQTSFTCEREYRGYYADEEAGCQLFHVCDGNFLVSSFLCPVGSTFSQKLLTCDWWNKVDCSATRNFYQANDQIIISQVDDDEILRKAYEMTSLHSTRNGVAVMNPKDQFNTNVNRKLSHVNEIQSGGINQYSDYQSSPSITVNKYPKFKYSSRYSSDLDQHDRDIDYYPSPSDGKGDSPIRVEPIGDSYGNNNEKLNNFESSYAPTVPTVTTTTRRYYSPTIPPIIRSTPRLEKHDLDFESSDHLYSAKGKHSSITRQDATQLATEKIELILATSTSPPLNTSTPSLPDDSPGIMLYEMLSSTIGNDTNSSEIPSLVYKAPVNDEYDTVSSNEFRSTTEFSPSTLHTRTNYSLMNLDRNNTDFPENADESVIPNPSIEFLPPFFYYSNAEQHDAVLVERPEKLIFNLTASDDVVVTSPENLQNRASALVNDGSARDTADSESSPFQVTVTLKNNEFHPSGDLLRKFIAQQDPSSMEQIKDIEIIKSENYGNLDNIEKTPAMQINENGESKISRVSTIDSRSRSYFDIVPRPFSLRPPNYGTDIVNYDKSITELPILYSSTNIESNSRYFDAVTSMSPLLVENNTAPNDESASVYSEKTQLLQQLEHTLGQPLYKVQRQVIFGLPNQQRPLDFQNGESLHREIQEKEESEIADDRNTTDYAGTRVAVETELVPSLGFSLDTEEDREQYVDAVLRGLFKDINVSEVDAKSVNITDS